MPVATDELKCPKLFLTPTDCVTQYGDVAVTHIWALLYIAVIEEVHGACWEVKVVDAWFHCWKTVSSIY